jgi:VWFA-related protein
MRLPTWLGGLGSVRKMAEETGGEEIDVQRVGSLQAALAAVVSRLKTRYTLGYNSTNKARDGAFRRIEVRLTDRFGRPSDDYSVFARSGYYAPVERRAAEQPPAQPAENH